MNPHKLLKELLEDNFYLDGYGELQYKWREDCPVQMPEGTAELMEFVKEHTEVE